MVWTCEKCGAINSDEVSSYNRVRMRQVATCETCGAQHPEGYYSTV